MEHELEYTHLGGIKMTKQEALKKGREIRQEKIFKKLYEENKTLINQNHPVTYEMWKARVKKAWGDNPRYSEVKSLVAAGRKMLHTTEYISKETIGIENIKEGLKKMKTGRTMAWGKPKFTGYLKGVPQYRQTTKEETMFDVFKRLTGVGRKFDIYWSEESKSYHFIGKDYLEYEIIVYSSPIRYGIELYNK